MANEFDTDLNVSFHSNVQDTQTSTVADLVGGVTATVVDVGASLWNSLPLTENVDTADLLSRVSDNALRVYEENPDTIHTASFIAGMFLPAGLAMKGIGAMRAGSKGVNWFSALGKEADLAKMKGLIEAGQAETTAFRSLQRSIYAKGFANQALDAVAGEAAIVAMLNQHPLMEDYMQDPVKNFAISAGIGGALGGVIGHIADRYVANSIHGNMVEGALDATVGKMKAIREDMTMGTALQTYKYNVESLQNILNIGKEAGKTADNDLTMSFAAKVQLQMRADQVTLFEEMISPEMRALPLEKKGELMRMFADKPEMFGVQEVKLLKDSDFIKDTYLKAPKIAPMDKPTFFSTNSSKGPTVPTKKDAVYDPRTGLYYPLSEIHHYTGAGALGLSEKQLVDKYASHSSFGKVPNLDSSLELASTTAAEIEAKHIAYRAKVDAMDEKALGRLVVSETDIAMMSAVVLRLRKDPDLARRIQISVADRSPVMKAILEEKNQAMTAAGLPMDYATKVKGMLSEKSVEKYMPMGVDVAAIADNAKMAALTETQRDAAKMLRGWFGGGGIHRMRQASTAYFAKGFASTAVRRDAGQLAEAKIFKEIYESDGSKLARAEFSQLADSEGYVLMYRGNKATDKTLRGHAPLESYTMDPAKGQHHGTTRLYKVHVEDIVAVSKDIPDSDGLRRSEVIVAAGARPIEAVLSKDGTAVFKQTQIAGQAVAGAPALPKAWLPDLEDSLRAAKMDAVDTMLTEGYPFQAISLKTNTPIDVIERYAGMAKGPDSFDLAVQWQNKLNQSDKTGILTATADDVKAALDPALQPLVLSGNLKKNVYTEAHANLNNKQMAQMNKEFVASSMFSSKSQTVQDMADYFWGTGDMRRALDVMETELSKVNNPNAGTKFFQSTDFYARMMGSVGPISTAIGKKIQQVSNSAIGRIVKPMEEFMQTVVKDPIAVIEANAFREVHASLSGWRMFDGATGKLMQKVERTLEDGTTAMVVEAVKREGVDYVVQSKSVRDMLVGMQLHARELMDLTNAGRRIKGQANVNDIGFWLPSFNPTNKFIGYVHDVKADSTKLLWGRTEAELNDRVLAYKQHLTGKGIGPDQIRVVDNKSDQAAWNLLNGRLDPIHMEVADTTMLKAGKSAQALPSTTTAVFGEWIGGYEHYVNAQVRNLAELNMSEVTDKLARMSQMSKAGMNNQPLSDVRKWSLAKKDAAATIRNTLLGSSNLGENQLWSNVNKSFETYLTMSANTMRDVFQAGMPKNAFGKSKVLTEETIAKADYEKIASEMAAKGMYNPWKAFDDEAAKMFGLSRLEDHADTSKRIIYASNALAATVALRIGELAQPLVNILSLPILTSLAVSSKMPEHFMGIAKGTANVSGVQVMYEGARAANSPLYKHLDARWAKLGYYEPLVSEASDTLKMARSFEKGATAKVEKALDSQMVRLLSKPADWSESFVRRQTMFTGAVLAKRLYPELDDVGVTIFARDFMDKAVGNFHASQRPTFYQGTLGVALGLFQTYSQTLGQSIYRQLEMKNYKALGKAALTQSAVFGTESLPGFNAVSEMIGDHFSDENVDLTTGTYRALPDKMADMVLYGLPSNLGPGISSRGDSDPRFPNIAGGFQNTVAVNFVSQTMQMMGEVQRAMSVDNKDVVRAMGQALSLQNMSRPVARTAELATGYSITRAGNTVQVPEEVWTATGIFARVLGTRPIEETKLREAMHLNTFYGSVDRERREKVTSQLKTAIRGGELDDAQIAKFADEYMRHGGTPTGWRSAYKTAIAKTESSGKESFIEKLKPDNPLMFMMDNMD